MEEISLGCRATLDEEPFSESDTHPLQAFAELFLTYAFTLPGMLAERHPEDLCAAFCGKAIHTDQYTRALSLCSIDLRQIPPRYDFETSDACRRAIHR